MMVGGAGAWVKANSAKSANSDDEVEKAAWAFENRIAFDEKIVFDFDINDF